MELKFWKYCLVIACSAFALGGVANAASERPSKSHVSVHAKKHVKSKNGIKTAGIYSSVTFTWTDQRAGDCHMTGVLTLTSDGNAAWNATTKTDSTHSKDKWHESSIDIKDSSGAFLFGFGPWESPPMDSPPNGGNYNWNSAGTFSPTLLDRAATGTATSNASC